MRTRILTACGSAALALLIAEPAMARECSDLAAAASPDLEVTSAAIQPAWPFTLPAEFGPATTAELTAF